jgi:hypothetical protein
MALAIPARKQTEVELPPERRQHRALITVYYSDPELKKPHNPRHPVQAYE